MESIVRSMKGESSITVNISKESCGYQRKMWICTKYSLLVAANVSNCCCVPLRVITAGMNEKFVLRDMLEFFFFLLLI